jgi:hypothetical protein
VVNGDFESEFPGVWAVSGNSSESYVTLDERHGGSRSLHLIRSGESAGDNSDVSQILSPLTPNVDYTLSYWYRPGSNGIALTTRLAGGTLESIRGLGSDPAQSAMATPGRRNSVRAALPAFPPVW